MNEDKKSKFSKEIGAKVERKLKARRAGGSPLGFGVGMMGLVGWSVAIPTLLGAAAGVWLDNSYKSSISWTLALLVAGLCLGCFNAAHWVASENRKMQDEDENNG